MKAQVAIIDLGFTQFEGLMLPNGDYAIGVPQIASLIQTTQNTASRDFNRLLGDGFSPSKQSIEGTKALVNVVDLPAFTKILYAMAKRDNAIADALIQSLLEEGFERRFDIAFGKKVDEAEYNQRLALRMKRLVARRKWTDVLQERHVEFYGCKPTPKQFKDWTVLANEVLFSKKHFNCDRDNMQAEEQELIEHFEYGAVRLARLNPDLDPDQILGQALSFLS